MTTYYAQLTDQSWAAANQWNTAANGSGSYGTPGAGDTCYTNGKKITLDVDVTVAKLFVGITYGLTVSGSRTITGEVEQSGSGAYILFSSGASLTVNGKTTVRGLLFWLGGTKSLNLNNPTGDALVIASDASTGSAAILVPDGDGGQIEIDGDVHSLGSTVGILRYYENSTEVSGVDVVHNGDLYGLGTGTAYSITDLGGGCRLTLSGSGKCEWGTKEQAGKVLDIYGSPAEVASTATILGEREISSDAACVLSMVAGTLTLADETGAALISNSGHFSLVNVGGTVVTESGENVAQVVQMTATATQCAVGCDLDLVGPTLPEAAYVLETADDYGYAGALIEPTAPLVGIDANGIKTLLEQSGSKLDALYQLTEAAGSARRFKAATLTQMPDPSSAAIEAIAAAVLTADVSGAIEAAAAEYSLCYVILAMGSSDTITEAGKLTVYRSDGETVFATKDLTTAESTEAITAMG